VFTSTPTKLTHSTTTSSRVEFSCFSGTSCWYMPTPKCFGSTFTSSPRGSCNLRAKETVNITGNSYWLQNWTTSHRLSPKHLTLLSRFCIIFKSQYILCFHVHDTTISISILCKNLYVKIQILRPLLCAIQHN
jgi:hypothetical protein